MRRARRRSGALWLPYLTQLLSLTVAFLALVTSSAASSMDKKSLICVCAAAFQAGWHVMCRFQVERLLESVDAVIYLLDYTKLKTQEEANLLKKLRDINPQLFQRLSQRLFFCVNKADAVSGPLHMHAAPITTSTSFCF